jgi:hypothetical protein
MCLPKILMGWNQGRSEAHSRMEDWIENLPSSGVRAVCSWERFCTFARDCTNNHLIYFRFSLPKPSNSNIVAREPISSIDGRRRSFFSFGWPASTTESVPQLSRTTSISRLI